jgi:hypothetical protein
MTTEFNCETGEAITRPMTDAEVASYNESQRLFAIEQEELLVAQEEAAIAKASAQAKLSALGLTAQEIAALTK